MFVQLDGTKGFSGEDPIPVTTELYCFYPEIYGNPTQHTSLFVAKTGDLFVSSHDGNKNKEKATIDLPYEAVVWALNRASRSGVFSLSLMQKDLPAIKAEYNEYTARRSTVSNSNASRPGL